MKLSQLLFWILETQDFPTNVHLEPNLGMMGVQKKNVYCFLRCVCGTIQAWAPDYMWLFSKTYWFLYQNSAHTNA